MTTRPGYVWDATASEWVEIGQAAVVSPFKYQTSQPSSPATGDIWIDSDDEVPSVDSTLYYRWTKTMSGGETSLSGTDNNSLALKYTPGYESVFINGVLQVRGSDYVATTGTTVTGLIALTASDVVMVESIVAYSVGDTYTQSTLDGKFSPITTTGLVLLNTTTFTAQASVSIDNVFTSTYDNYKIVCDFTSSTDQEVFFRLRASGADLTTSVYRVGEIYLGVGIANALTSANNTLRTSCTVSNNGSGFSAGFVADVIAPNKAQAKFFNSQSTGRLAYINIAQIQQATAYTGFTILVTAATTFTGTIKVYGYKQEIDVTRAREIASQGGLVLISSTTVGSAVSSVTINNAFSATYDDYLIIGNGGTFSRGNGDFGLQLTGITSTDYRYSFIYSPFNNTPTALGSSTATQMLYAGGGESTTGWNIYAIVRSPFLTKTKNITSFRGNGFAAGTTSCFVNNSTSSTGFSLLAGVESFTGGTISVYGYKKQE